MVKYIAGKQAARKRKDKEELSMPEKEDKITILSSQHCLGCSALKKAVKSFHLTDDIEILDIEKDKNAKLAEKLNINYIPIAIINGKKYDISKDDKCLIFKNKKNKIEICKKP